MSLYDYEAIIKSHSGVSTVWLISTLGNKSSYKKISKKEIQSVSIPQTCGVISNPPRPMALRLTSSLLYGVALIYKQKTDYLNNDTVLTKTRIQRDIMYGSKTNNGENLLLDGRNTIISCFNNSKSDGNKYNNRQVLLNDDPFFNIQTGFVPSMEGLEFLDITSEPHEQVKLQRINAIREADVANKIISTTISSSQSSSQDEFGLKVTGAIGAVDDLDANDPMFAFDEDGLLLDLEVTGAANEQLDVPVRGPEEEYGFDIDFGGYDDFAVPLEENNVQNIEGMDQVIEERQVGETGDEADNNIIGKKPKKKRKPKASSVKIVIDDQIGLFTEDLRLSRDGYVENMKRPLNKRQKLDNKLNELKKLFESETLIPQFNSLMSFNHPIELGDVERGRKRHRDNEDFVDGLMRDRGSSYSIEVGRNVPNRRDSRSSIGSINLPLNDLQDDNHNNLGYPQEDEYFDVDFGGGEDLNRVPINQANQGYELGSDSSSKKRSSSTTRRIGTVQEDHILDFDLDLGGDFEDFNQVANSRLRSSRSPSVESQSSQRQKRRDLSVDEINKKYGKQTLKFLKYIESRCAEEEKNPIPFNELIDGNSKKSIIVKSFYEILQLATLNQVELVNNQSKRNKFKIMQPHEFEIMI